MFLLLTVSENMICAVALVPCACIQVIQVSFCALAFASALLFLVASLCFAFYLQSLLLFFF